MTDLQVQYDSICYYIFNAVCNLSHGADNINLKNFDGKDEEHLLVLSVTMACYNILGEKPIAIDGSAWVRRKLAAKYKKDVSIIKNKTTDDKQIDVGEVLEGLRGWACSMCGEDFRFGDIYRAYYCGKEER